MTEQQLPANIELQHSTPFLHEVRSVVLQLVQLVVALMLIVLIGERLLDHSYAEADAHVARSVAEARRQGVPVTITTTARPAYRVALDR